MDRANQAKSGRAGWSVVCTALTAWAAPTTSRAAVPRANPFAAPAFPVPAFPAPACPAVAFATHRHQHRPGPGGGQGQSHSQEGRRKAA